LKNTIVRDGLGRIQGSIADYYINESESWIDYKERDLVFPRHSQGKSSPVTTWNLNDKKN
jgi:hypothetical protein